MPRVGERRTRRRRRVDHGGRPAEPSSPSAPRRILEPRTATSVSRVVRGRGRVTSSWSHGDKSRRRLQGRCCDGGPRAQERLVCTPAGAWRHDSTRSLSGGCGCWRKSEHRSSAHAEWSCCDAPRSRRGDRGFGSPGRARVSHGSPPLGLNTVGCRCPGWRGGNRSSLVPPSERYGGGDLSLGWVCS